MAKINRKWINLNSASTESVTSEYIPYQYNDTTTIKQKIDSLPKIDINANILRLLYLNADGQTINSTNFIFDAVNNTLGINATADNAFLDVYGTYTSTGRASLRLRGGIADNTSLYSPQILFSYGATPNYNHAIFTRHNSGVVDDNKIQFALFKPGVDTTNSVPSTHILTIAHKGLGIGTSAIAMDPQEAIDIDYGDGSAIRLNSLISKAIFSVQDGTGRIQLKWNATKGINETFISGSENASRYIFDPPSNIFSIDWADGTNALAGDAITWTNILNITSTNAKIFGNEIVRCLTPNGYKIWVGTQLDYDALGTYNADTLYFII